MIKALFTFVVLATTGTGRIATHTPAKATIGTKGDSIAQGGPLAVHVANLLPDGYRGFTGAFGGETADQIAHRVIAETATDCLGEPCGTWIVQGAVNTLKLPDYVLMTDEVVSEIALNGDGASILGMADAWDYLHATYPHNGIIAIGVLPFKGCDFLTCPFLVRPGERARTYNAKFLAACAQRPWLACLSPYADFEDPLNPDYLDPDIAYSDGIHLVQAGYVRLAPMIAALKSW